MPTYTQARDIVWLPKDIADRFNSLEEGTTAEAYILEYARKLEEDTKVAIASLDDELLLLKARGVTYKKLVQDALAAEQEDMNALWRSIDTASARIKKQTESAVAPMTALTERVEELSSVIEGINIFRVEQAHQAIDGLSRAIESLTPKMSRIIQHIAKQDP